ncbi:uncharacterized protein LOC118434112 [Folsomia candida]|uniref:uncharacterized protein LOC118434112 n=1 Tax=Folsomia candida TaxID=158441 RepID=UPI001605477D|nr:uncharacterized protein LOC118434112 [Folsomia candida]
MPMGHFMLDEIIFLYTGGNCFDDGRTTGHPTTPRTTYYWDQYSTTDMPTTSDDCHEVLPEPCGINLNPGGNAVRNGVCLPGGQCELREGEKDGDCVDGFGECCKFTASCTSTQHNVTIYEEVVTLNTHQPLDTDCIYEIRRKSDKYCGVKLDFVAYNSQHADDNGICSRDSITIRGTSTVPDGFVTCGDLTGQHMYLNFNKAGSIEILPSFTTMGGGSYQIVASQYGCVSPLRPPDNSCLQYFNSTRGVVKSFGYPVRQQSSQQYTVCVGGSNSRSITWRPCSAANAEMKDPPFKIASNPNGPASPDWICRPDRDWVQVNGANQMCKPSDIPGNGIKSSFTPFLLNVNFNDVEKAELPCTEDIMRMPETACVPDFTAPPAGIVPPCVVSMYDECFWNATATPSPGRCECDPKPATIAGLEWDIYNWGFCLEYTQSSRK